MANVNKKEEIEKAMNEVMELQEIYKAWLQKEGTKLKEAAEIAPEAVKEARNFRERNKDATAADVVDYLYYAGFENDVAIMYALWCAGFGLGKIADAFLDITGDKIYEYKEVYGALEAFSDVYQDDSLWTVLFDIRDCYLDAVIEFYNDDLDSINDFE